MHSVRLAPTLLTLTLAGAALAAPPEIPDQVPYSAVVPGGGAGPVDLTLRIYDAAASGTLLYVQDFADVPLVDGAFTLALGPTGRATDAPTDPLTTSLVAALAGDLAATAPGRFVEVTVNTDPPLPRERVLAVPFALRAASAESAETAESANSVTHVGGVPPEVLGQIFANFDFGDGGPPNSDPSEGLGDVDGDGVANFLDSDNDADAQSDSAEVAQGSDINLITPTISSIGPPVPGGAQATVHVAGTFFEPGLSVVFGSQTPTPSNLTATGFDVLVGPQTGEVTVTVTRLNGQSASTIFEFGDAPSVQHSTTAVAGAALDFDVSTSALLVGRSGSHSVATAGPFSAPIAANNIATAWDPLGRVAVARFASSVLSYAVDTNGDFVVDGGSTIESGVGVAHASLVFDPSGRPAIGYLKNTLGTQVMLARDLTADGDFVDAGELVLVQSFGGTTVRRSELAFDAAGRAAYLYQVAVGNTLRFAYDLNGDGDFADTVGGTPERIVIASGSGDTDCFGVTFDSAGRLALTYQNPANGAAVLARDGNGDGEVNDAGERVEYGPAAVCDGERTSAGGLLFVHGGTGLVQLRDRNNDGDFTDPAESGTVVLSTPVTAVEIGSDEWVASQTHAYLAP